MQKIGNYQIKKKIGSGGMGTVYLAFDELLKRTVALKVLSSEKAKNPILVKRFKSEAQSAARLKDKNIITVYEAGEASNRHFISLEYFEGVDVHELVERHGVLSVKRSLDIIKKMAKALKHAHKQSIVHRDIKPSNIMISRKGEVKLTDMGLARILDDEDDTAITKAGTTVGTVDYMSPEQARNSRYADTRSDIYSLGCTWYHMLTGQPPFPEGGLTKKLYDHASSDRPDPRELNDKIPESIVAIIYRMMSQKPDDRYQTPSELLKDLEDANTTPDMGADAIASAMTELAETEVTSTTNMPYVPKQTSLPPRDIKVEDSDSDSDSDSEKKIKKSFSFTPISIVAGAIVLIIIVAALMPQGPTKNPNNAIDGDAARKKQDLVNKKIKPQKIIDEEKDTDSVGVLGSAPTALEYPILKPVPDKSAGHLESLTIGQQTEKPYFPGWVSKVWDGEKYAESADTAGLKAIRVGRNDEITGDYKTLNEAIYNLKSKKTVIELLGEGPFILSTTKLSDSGNLIITGKETEKSVIILVNTNENQDSPILQLTKTDLVLDHVDLYYDAHQHEDSPATLFGIESGNLTFRRGSLTVNSNSDTEVTAFHFFGESEKTRLKQQQIPHILMDRVFMWGKNLLPLKINKDFLGLCASNSLFVTGKSPVIHMDCLMETDVRPSDNLIYRDLRFFSCTMIPFDHAFHFLPGINSKVPPITRIYSMNTVFSKEPDSGETSRLLELENWPQVPVTSATQSDAINLRWFSDDSVFLNWKLLIQNESNQLQSGIPSDNWINYWGSQGLDTDRKQFQKEKWPTQALSSITELHPGSFSKGSMNIPVLKSNPDWTPGADSSLLPYNVMQYRDQIQRLTLREILYKNQEKEEQIKEEQGKTVTARSVDLTKLGQRDLGKVIGSQKWADGTVFEVSGRGKHLSSPIVIKNQSIHIRFVDTDKKPFYIQPKITIEKGKEQYLFEVSNGNISISNGFFVVNNSRTQNVNGVVYVNQGSFSLKDTIIISKKKFSTHYQDVIKWTGSDINSNEQNQFNSTGRIENSFIISNTPLINIEKNGYGLFINNSVFASTSDIIKLDQQNDSQEKYSFIDIQQSTFSAAGNVLQSASIPSTSGAIPQVQIFVENSVFAPPFLSKDKRKTMSTICDFQDLSLNKNVSWYGKNNGFSQAINAFFQDNSNQKQTSISEFWINKWGPANIIRPLYDASGVSLKEKLGELDDIQPASFQLDPNCKALNWNALGKPIGCDLSKISWKVYAKMKKKSIEKDKKTKKGRKEKKGIKINRPKVNF